MKIIAVIPARGGSKGIPRKNMRLMNGKPLIAYSIQNALDCPLIDEVVVSTDSEEIMHYVSRFESVKVIKRDSSLSGDEVTLDPVVSDAVQKVEKELSCKFDIVVTLQPTSPLLKVQTLKDALAKFCSSKDDSMISVTNAPHLSWKVDEATGSIIPNYEKRLNRQLLPPNFLETGAFLITKRDYVSQDSRLGREINVFEVPKEESIDIDSREDWILSEAILKRKTIVFRVDGYKELGMGHIYRALTLAYKLTGHEVVFICNSMHTEGIEKLKSAFMRVVLINNNDELFCWLKNNPTDIFVYDCLDSEVEFIRNIKRLVGRVITFEDLGAGSFYADCVINALYEQPDERKHVFSGKDYACLRDEFIISGHKMYSEKVRNVLVMFGGTDPLDMTSRLFSIAKEINKNETKINFYFILGAGYKGSNVDSYPDAKIHVVRNVDRVSDYMLKADLAVSSQGRTTYELACIGVPTVVIAQNEREQLHDFARMSNGFINLGLGQKVSDEDIKSTIRWLINASTVRKQMYELMLKNDLKKGIDRVISIILGE